MHISGTKPSSVILSQYLFKVVEGPRTRPIFLSKITWLYFRRRMCLSNNYLQARQDKIRCAFGPILQTFHFCPVYQITLNNYSIAFETYIDI